MRYGYLHLLIVCVFLSAEALLADPFRQIEVNSEEYKEALKKAQQPVDAAKRLAQPVPEIRLQEIPFVDVIDAMRDWTSANIVVNYHALERVGLDRAEPITLVGKDISGAEILDHMLKPFAKHGVEYRVDKDVVYISSKDDLDALDDFRKRNPVVFVGGPVNPRLVIQSTEDLDRPNVRVSSERLVVAVNELSRRSGLTVRVDKQELARVRMDGDENVSLRLRNPYFGDALAAALWVTGRIDSLDLRVEGTTITVVGRVVKVAK